MKECDICHYRYFKDVSFKYEKYLCNVCHDLMQKAMSFNDIAVVYVKRSAHRIHFWYMSKDDAVNIIFFFVKNKNGWKHWLNYYQKNKDLILNKAKDYYENDKERLTEQPRNKYRNLSEEEKN